jgi:hypothetical protein
MNNELGCGDVNQTVTVRDRVVVRFCDHGDKTSGCRPR